MSCLGAFHALPEMTAAQYRRVPRNERPAYLEEALAEGVGCYDLAQSWDAMHRTLTGGLLRFGNKPAPGCLVVLGGEVLYGDAEGEEDHIIVLKSADQVRQVADWLGTVGEEFFRRAYFSIDPADYGMAPDEDDFQFTWEYFRDSLAFWQAAAGEKAWVLFDAAL